MIDAQRNLTADESTLRKYALGFPETTEDFPWGHRAFKVNKKIFVTMTTDDDVATFSVKLPASGRAVLKKPFAEPTHYGMGKHGWVTLTFKNGKKLPVADLKRWIDESFRAIAPKALVKSMAPAASKKSPTRK
jgi:predicted DNA-binding protein (MmcQ/YjbR family)